MWSFEPSRRTSRALGVAAIAGLSLLLGGCYTRTEEQWYDNGVLRSRGPVHAWSGLRHGEWIFQHANGEPKERGAYAHGYRVGVWTQWYPDGQLRARGGRIPDPASGSSPRHGPWVYWHENGIPAARGIYERGLSEGVWERTLDDGGLDGDHSGVHHQGELLGFPVAGAPKDDQE